MSKQLQIRMPYSASHLTARIQSGEQLGLDFDETAANFHRSGKDLILSFENGGSITVQDFFTSTEETPALPPMVLNYGTSISSELFLKALNPEFDTRIEAAAGPESRAEGSGLGAYGDSAGEPLNGIDRLGMHDPFFWGGNTAERPEAITLDRGSDVSGGTPAGPVEPTSLPYTARAELYTEGDWRTA